MLFPHSLGRPYLPDEVRFGVQYVVEIDILEHITITEWRILAIVIGHFLFPAGFNFSIHNRTFLR